ncbi:sulfotransferase [Sediminibacter sp. Hel_I_10]|uniref:sulfotransferase n=1 Tax=Sediminibacter sp. Hel_I_10 TaxID=1392490 RepID=UPI00047AD5CA|nr:sulfotransferase [Sediminibacter sp. Hel_I_10]
MNFLQVKMACKKVFQAINIQRKPLIFCISFQRTGTTSVGRFFHDHNFSVATSHTSVKNGWTSNWFKGDYKSIFNSLDFKSNQVFEDDPWWCLDFYKFLFHRFPGSKFILLERDPDKWFNSMMTHSDGKSLGNTFIHSHLYRREKEFYSLSTDIELYNKKTDNLLKLSEEHRAHYIEIYKLRIREVKDFFKYFDQDRLFCGDLEDSEKWKKMGSYFGFRVEPSYKVHIKSPIIPQNE